MTEKITSNQENRIADLVRDAVRASGFSKDEAQEIISSGGILQEELKPVLKKLAIADKRFGAAIREFEITVPADYKHDTQIDSFAKRVKKEKTTYYFNDAFTSKNFRNATNKLAPSKKLKVKIFPILKTVTSEDCILFLKKQNAILAGGQGATLLYDLAKEQLPKDKWTVSFDEKDSLWKDSDGNHRVPYVLAYSDGDFEFSLGRFESDWGAGHCLVCFCD